MREDVLNNVGDAGGFEEAGLKKQIMVDRSAPVVGGQYQEDDTDPEMRKELQAS